jgi:hypothetical protein
MSDLTNVIVVDGVRVVTHTPHSDGADSFDMWINAPYTSNIRKVFNG